MTDARQKLGSRVALNKCRVSPGIKSRWVQTSCDAKCTVLSSEWYLVQLINWQLIWPQQREAGANAIGSQGLENCPISKGSLWLSFEMLRNWFRRRLLSHSAKYFFMALLSLVTLSVLRIHQKLEFISIRHLELAGDDIKSNINCTKVL